jgi:hypothetical protein
LNVEQEIIKNVGAFARLGWSDGQNEAGTFADVDRTATLSLRRDAQRLPKGTTRLQHCHNTVPLP